MRGEVRTEGLDLWGELIEILICDALSNISRTRNALLVFSDTSME